MLHISDLAKLSPARRAAVLTRLSEAEQEQLVYDWRFQARPEQLAPDGNWLVWTFCGGRGSGKTRSGAEWIREKIKNGASNVALIAPTAGDARDVMVEGLSGLKAISWEHDRTIAGVPMGMPLYEPSKRRLTWANGATGTLFSAEEPERLRGPQHQFIWGDEVAAWADPQAAWDMAMFGLRVGNHPQAMVTTTPKPLTLVRELLRPRTDGRYVVTRGSTWSNRAHLAASFFKQVVERYQGTRLGRQELEGELLEDVEGALWTRGMIEKGRVEGPPDLRRIVVAIDPPATSSETSALAGIVVAGMNDKGDVYVLEDGSGRFSPGEWAARAIKLYNVWNADRIIAEGNQGGEMVSHTIKTIMPNAPVKIVHASRAKQARAEPVVAMYEQGRVHHAGVFPEMEDQLTTWAPLEGAPSPDRLDALVWAITDLMASGRAMKRPADAAAAMARAMSQGSPRTLPGAKAGWMARG